MQSLDDSSYKEKLRELNFLSLEDMRENRYDSSLQHFI